MATDTVKDYLGHPCKTTEAFEIFEESVARARKYVRDDKRSVARNLGIELLKVQKRLEHISSLVEAGTRLLPNDIDSDGILALLEAGEEYTIKTSSEFYDFAGMVLVALEVGGMWKGVPAEEVQHG